MKFSLSAEQRDLKEAAAAFARAKLNEDLAKGEESGEFPLGAWHGGTSGGGSDQRLCQPGTQGSGPLPLANAAPRLMKTGVLESLSLGGSRG